MDSRLMNVVYDDPFDGNYTKYDNDTEFWSSGSDTMGMQLTETLHGILPIAPTADDFRKDDNSVSTSTINLQNNKNSFTYGGFAEQHFASGGAIEIVTVDPNADVFDTTDDDSEDDADEDDESNDEDKNNNLINFDYLSHSSNLTFRTRTDSSSIGDYESHTSDYEDDDSEDESHVMTISEPFLSVAPPKSNINPNESIQDMQSGVLLPDMFMLSSNSYAKNRTISSNTVSSSDVDGLELNIDANNFDLAEFITKDDFAVSSTGDENNAAKMLKPQNRAINTTSTIIARNNLTLQQVVSTTTKPHIDSDSDSDVIVDVETVEIEDEVNVNTLRKASESLIKPELTIKLEEEDLTYIDNVTSDPSWSPIGETGKKIENLKMEDKSSTQKQNFTKSFNIVPNKKQCDILKGKFGKAKAKPIQQKAAVKKGKTKLNENLPQSIEPTTSSDKKTGIGMGGKNLALLKHAARGISISENSSEDNSSTPIKCSFKMQQNSTSPIDIPKIIDNNEEETPAQQYTLAASQAVKRKLNLEEYKIRRGDSPNCFATRLESYKIPKLENNTPVYGSNNNKKPESTSSMPPIKHSVEVASIVKTLKEQQQVKSALTLTDPITEAKNKVLRMQELKKAQQMRIIDSTISAKVPRVTKLLPLREIIKDTPYSVNDEKNENQKQSLKCHPDYEEIIVVSTGCNTEISLPPENIDKCTKAINTATRSLLKSTALLSSISNSFQKAQASENVKISNNSLIASIQDVVVKKSRPAVGVDESCNNKCVLKGKIKSDHGEDKIIMHLRKDRIRKRTHTMGTQTDLQPEFPIMSLPKTTAMQIQHKSRERERRKKHKHRQYRKHKVEYSSESSSDSDDNSSDNQSVHSYSSSTLSRSRDNSCSSSVERMRVYDSAIGTGGYSSRSSRKHRSSISSYSDSMDHVGRGRRQRRTSFKQRSKRSGSPYSSSSSYTSDSDRSRSPLYRRSRSRSKSRVSRKRRTSYRQQNNNNYLDRNVSQPAVEERRIVYVGRIDQETTKDMLRRKFLPYGTIKQISIHYKDTGMKYGFVTFEKSEDAFTAIDASTRDPQISMYDVSFGGRRAFCRASYADLDNAGINTYQSYVFPQKPQQPKEEDSFEALLMKMKAKLNANKKPISTSSASSGNSDLSQENKEAEIRDTSKTNANSKK